MFSSHSFPSLAQTERSRDDDVDDEKFKLISFPVFSSTVPPLRPSVTSSSYRDTKQYDDLFGQSCAQIREQLAARRWPFCPIYLLHVNTYCHLDCFAIPAEIALVETTFWPQSFGSVNDVQAMGVSRKVKEHYERHSHLYKRCCSITDDFHDFVHPGDQLPTGCQADILQHSRRTHGLPCTPYEKIGTQDYNQLLDDLHEMLGSLCDRRQPMDNTPMPMFCTIESFWSTKAALDWLYDQPSTRDRTDDYTLYPIEALIAVVYETYYSRAQFKCDLAVLMGKTPQQPVLHSRACDYHAILENKHCAMAHVRDLAEYYISLMAYLYYTYCDQNSSALLPYVKATFQGNLALQQEAYWSVNRRPYGKTSIDSRCLSLSSSSSNNSLNEKPFEAKPAKKGGTRRNNSTRTTSMSNLNPLAVPFTVRSSIPPRPAEVIKTSARLVVFEPRASPTPERSCATIHQRLRHRPREDWDASEPLQHR